jgi:hypothetical protein
MGQYFKCINLDKREWFTNGGLKLWEWAANLDESGLITTLLSSSKKDGWLIKNSMSLSKKDGWAGDRLVLLGDYDTSKEFKGLYEIMTKSRNIVKRALRLFMGKRIQSVIKSKETLYLVNMTDEVFIKGSFKQISICLPLLLRQSTDGGGGDIDEDYESAGIFVEKRLYVTDNKSEIEGLKDISSPVFKDAFDFYNR